MATNTFPETGNVGIGTLSPQDGQLQVQPEQADAAHGITLKRQDGTAAKSYLKSNGANDYNWFLTRDADTKGLVIDKDGNVGIGAINPQNGQLEIQPTVADENHGVTLKMQAGTAAKSYLKLTADSSDYNWFLTRNADTKGLVIDKDGNVGIGAIDPKAQLRLESGRSALSDGSPLADPASYTLWLNRNANEQNKGAGLAFGSSTNPTEVGAVLVYERTGDQQKGKLHFYTKQDTISENAPKQVMTLSDNGNVGIGITNPQDGQLQVQPEQADAAHGITLKMQAGTAAKSYLKLTADSSDYNWFLTRDADTKGLVIDKDGNVGIGATDPKAQLRLESGRSALSDGSPLADPASYTLWLNRNANEQNKGAGLAFGSSTNPTEVGAALIYERTDAKQQGKLHFYTKQNTEQEDAPKQVMTLDDNGNVGIGITNPQNGQLEIRPTAADNNHGITLKRQDGTAAKSYLKSNGANDYNWFLTRDTDTKGLIIDKDGNAGIGAINSKAQLKIESNRNALSGLANPANHTLWLNRNATDNNQGVGLAFGSTNSNDNEIGAAIVYEKTGDQQKGKLHFYTKQNTDREGVPTEVITLGDDGVVEIYKDLKIKNWSISVPDYVFGADYQLMELHCLEAYLAKNRHLPDLPSKEDIERHGLNLSEMTLLMLKKIEELTLYIIDQSRRIEEQQKQIDELIKSALPSATSK